MKKEASRLLLEDPHLEKEKIEKHVENLEKELEGVFTFGKQVDIQKQIGWKLRRRSGR